MDMAAHIKMDYEIRFMARPSWLVHLGFDKKEKLGIVWSFHFDGFTLHFNHLPGFLNP
jgi:hypothetical protein